MNMSKLIAPTFLLLSVIHCAAASEPNGNSFSAPVTKNQDGSVTLSYSWKNQRELNDWTVDGDPPTLKNGIVYLPPLTKLVHKVSFDDAFKVVGRIAMANRDGEHLSYGGVSVCCFNYNSWSVRLMHKDERLGDHVFDRNYLETGNIKKFLGFSLSVDKSSTKLIWGEAVLAASTENVSGELSLYGGKSGSAFAPLKITGFVGQESDDE
jgi:hypothetical protein